MKKLLLSLGTVAAIAAPVASVIACGSASLTSKQLANKAIKVIHSWNEYQKITNLSALGGGSQSGPGQTGLPAQKIPDKSVTYLVSRQSQGSQAPTSQHVVTGNQFDHRTIITAAQLLSDPQYNEARAGYRKSVNDSKVDMKNSISMVQYIFDHLSSPEAQKMMPQIGQAVGPILEKMSEGDFDVFDPNGEMPITTAFIKKTIIDPLATLQKANTNSGFADVFKMLLDSSSTNVQASIPKELWTESNGSSMMRFSVDETDPDANYYEVTTDIADYSDVLTNTYDMKLYFIYSIVSLAMDPQGTMQP